MRLGQNAEVFTVRAPEAVHASGVKSAEVERPHVLEYILRQHWHFIALVEKLVIRTIGVETAVKRQLVTGLLVVGTEILHEQFDQCHRLQRFAGMLPAGKCARTAACAAETMPVDLCQG